MATNQGSGNNPGTNPGSDPCSLPGNHTGNSSMDNTDPPSVRRRYVEEWEADRERSMFDQLHRLRRISEEIESSIIEDQEISFWKSVMAVAGGVLMFILVAMTSYGLIQLFKKYF